MNAGGFGSGRLLADGDRGLRGEPIRGECGGDTVMVDEEAVHVLDSDATSVEDGLEESDVNIS